MYSEFGNPKGEGNSAVNPWEAIYSYDDLDDPPEMLKRLIRFRKLCDLGEFWIRDEDAELVPLQLNLAQAVVLAACMKQAAARQPIRITVLKSRKTGISTFWEALCACLGAYYRNQRLKLIAHRDRSTREIFEIASRAAVNHPQRPCKALGEIVRWPDMDSTYVAETAGGTAVAAGETPNGVHLSEVAKWEKKKQETWTNVMNAVPRTLTSLVLVESTAKGRELFFDHWEASRAPGKQYIAIFIPWYFDERCTAPTKGKLSLDPDEQALMLRAANDGIELSHGMIQWRRDKIEEIGADAFRQEYPSTPTEAIQAASGIILPGMRECIVDELPFDPQLVPFGDRTGGVDFGYCDAAVIWSAFYLDQVLWVTGFWRGVESLACDQLDGLEEGHTYWCDPAQVTDRRQLAKEAREQGLHVRLLPAPRRKHPGEDCSTVELKALVRMGEQGRLRVMRDVATQLIVECDSFMWNETTGKADDRRTAAAGHFDSIMALKYMVMGADKPIARPAPPKAATMSRKQGFARV